MSSLLPVRGWRVLLALLAVVTATLVGARRVAAEPDAPPAAPPAVEATAPQADDPGPTNAPDPVALVPAPALPRLADGGAGEKVVVIAIEGTIDLGLAPYVRRVLAGSEGAALVVLDVDTFGGRVDAAVLIRDALLATDTPTLAYVDRRAISAGALISLAADWIVFTPGGSMGAATPIQLTEGTAQPVEEKMVSYMRGEMRATAEAKGRNGLLAEAMVDADIEVPGVSKPGKLLTVATDEARRIGLSSGTYRTLPEVLEAMGLEQAQVSRPESNWAEGIARILTDPTISGILLSLGMLGLVVELWSPGFGWPGAIGLSLLIAFFAGHMIVDLAGWEEVLLFTAGMALLGFEVFVTPGFGVVGGSGVVLVVASLVLAMTGLPLGVAWSTGMLTSSLAWVLLWLMITVVGVVLVVRFMPGRFRRLLVLDARLGDDTDAVSDTSWQANPTEWSRYLGMHGVALTDLRLAGKARLQGEVVDVVSLVDYLPRGTPVRVHEVEGVRVVVVRDDDPDPNGPLTFPPTGDPE